MRKTLIAASFVTVLAAPGLAQAQAAAAAPASPHTFTGNMSLVTDYRFRGISQTFKKPALQGGFDYSHASGLYLGNWNSTINEGAGFPASSFEMDFYGGWKKSWGDWGLDLGAIYYAYPGSDANTANGTAAAFTNPRSGQTHTGSISNFEAYVGVSWKWLSLKYYHGLDDWFSLADTKGSSYWDLTANYDLGSGWTLVGHVGINKVKNWEMGTDATKTDYTDWKIGVTKDLGGWILGAAYVDSSAKGNCSTGSFYCFANQLPAGAGSKFKDAGNGTLVLSVSKSF